MNILKLTHEDLVECERLDPTGKQLKALCILMGIPSYRLIWWRDNCRRKGQQALGEARECVRKQRAERRRVRPELWEGTL